MILRNLTWILCEALAKEIQVRSFQRKCQTKCEFNTCTARKFHMLFCKKCASSHFLLIWTQIQVSCWAVNEACISIDYNAVTSLIDVHSSCSAQICSCCLDARINSLVVFWSSCILTLLPLALFGVKHNLYFQQQLLPFTELVSRSKRGCHNWSVRDTLMAMWLHH